MPHASVKLKPGIDQNETPALNEAGISESNLIRFIPDRNGIGLIQKLGGWTKFYASQMVATVRALWAWEDTDANKWLAAGTDLQASNLQSQLAVMQGLPTSSGLTVGTSLTDITPRTITSNVTPSFSATAGSPIITITDAVATNITPYDSVYIAVPVAVGGLVISGLYPVYANAGSTSYSISAVDRLGVSSPAVISTAPAIAITGGSLSTGTETLTWSSPNYTFPVGSKVTVTGVLPSNWNGTFTVTASSATSVSFVNAAATSTWSSGGVPTNNGIVPYFTTTSSSGIVTVTLYEHGYSVGDTFPMLVSTTVGSITLYGNYIVQSVPNGYTFTINASQAAQSNATLPENFGKVAFLYSVGFGPAIAATGYGVGGYGIGGYGVGSPIVATTGTPIGATSWSLDNWGEILIANPTSPSEAILLISGGSGNGTTATLTYSGSVILPAGSQIVVANVIPAGYNGIYTVTTSSAGSVSYLNSTTAPITGPLLTFTNNLGTALAWQNNSAAAIYWQGVLATYGTITIDNPTGVPFSPIYQWFPTAEPSIPSIATIIAGAPTVNDSCFVAMPQRQIIALGSTFTGIPDPLLVRWCDINDYGQWVGSITNQAGSYRLPKGSRIVGGIQAPQQCLIWTDLGLWSMQYVSQPYVYSFNEIGTGCGMIAKRAAASLNGVTYWMGQSQFFKYAGDGVTPVMCPVWDVIFQDIDLTSLDKIRVAPNSRFGEVTWYYPTLSGGGEITNYVKYNTNLQSWDFGFLSRTAWINESVMGPPIGSDPSYIYQHETSPDADGQAMNSTFTTGYFTLQEGDLKTFIDQVWPDMKWGYYGGSQGATVSMQINYVDYPGQTPLVSGPFALTDATTYITPRLRGRLVQIKISSSDIGSFWRIGNIRYRFQGDGKF